MNDPPESEIGPVLPVQRTAALKLLFGEALSAEALTAHVAELVSAAGRGRLALEGLLAARRRGRVVGAVWVQPTGPGSAHLVPPRLAKDVADALASQLMQAAGAWIDARSIPFVQALAPTPTAVDAQRLVAAGFRHVTDLLYLMSVSTAFPPAEPDSGLTFDPCTEASDERLAAIVDATYEASCDCPTLNGLRSTQDVLADYRQAGVHDPVRWFLVSHQGREIGCLLLTDHPDAKQWELVYMGLVPAARGQGHGLEIVRRAQWLARQAGRSRLVLAVDAANHPAIDMYAAAGFTAWERKSVFIRTTSRRQADLRA